MFGHGLTVRSKHLSRVPTGFTYKKLEKLKSPAPPLLDRGTKIHQEAEDYVRGELGEMPESLKKFKSEFEVLREGFADAKVELEGEWGFTLDWETTGWLMGDTWARIKLDALVNEDETSCRVIDYKTGKKFGNEIAHGQQGWFMPLLPSCDTHTSSTPEQSSGISIKARQPSKTTPALRQWSFFLVCTAAL